MLYVRIDDRLIHGQTKDWCTELEINRIIIVHDGILENKILQKILDMSKPECVQIIEFYEPAHFILNANDINFSNTLLVTENLSELKIIVDQLTMVDDIIIGNIPKPDLLDRTIKKQPYTWLSGSVCLTQFDLDIISSIDKNFYIQTFIRDTPYKIDINAGGV